MSVPKIKICGITNYEDALASAECGADYLGFVINYTPSPRDTRPSDVADIIKKLKPAFQNLKFVGVFVNQRQEDVRDIVKRCGLDVVQLHGQEPPDVCSFLRQYAEVWKAVIIKKETNLSEIENYSGKANKILLDAGRGSGREISRRLLEGIKIDILAGGIGPDNISEIINECRPGIIDVNSGVESAPGKKDKALLHKLTRNMSETKLCDAGDQGYFGQFGGCYAPELLLPALEELDRAYKMAKKDPAFAAELRHLFTTYSGRPTPLYFAERLTKKLGGAKIYLKNEGLNHTGAHKINHCLGQALLAKRMGKRRLIAETGAGQHGLATATVAAKFGMECAVYMGEVDIARQRPNVFWMEQLGAEVIPVSFGTRRLKDAVMAALQDYMKNYQDSHYLLGSALGPHPYPTMVRDFQSIVGAEVKEQLQKAEGRGPDYLVACVGGGSNAIGLFAPFLADDSVEMIGVEAGGRGSEPGENAARLQGNGSVGVAEGYKSYFLQDEDGQLLPTHSIAAGLDYGGIGPQHAELFHRGRVRYTAVNDAEALVAFQLLAKTEGIFPALESAHAVAETIKLAPTLAPDKIIVVNLSGRGDKDIFIVAEALGDAKWKEYLKSRI